MGKEQQALSRVKKLYIENSMAHQGETHLKKALQSMAIAVLYLENNISEKYVLRDSRNMLYEMLKEIREKEGKVLIKTMIKQLK